MLARTDYFSLFQKAVIQAGQLALHLQGQITAETKSAEQFSTDSAYLTNARTVKTVLDEAIQDFLIRALLTEYPDAANDLNLDAEENTALKKRFSANFAHTQTLIIDPIDGTLPYLEGKDSFTVNVGLVENGKMSWAMIYNPTRDLFYSLTPDGESVLTTGWQNFKPSTQPINLPSTTQPIIYVNSRVPQSWHQLMSEAGFQVELDDRPDQNLTDTLLKFHTGEAAAYIGLTRQVRDVLLTAILSGSNPDLLFDVTGQPLSWVNHGRQPSLVLLHPAWHDQFQPLFKKLTL